MNEGSRAIDATGSLLRLAFEPRHRFAIVSSVLAASIVSNLVLLVPALFSIQIYDRILPTGRTDSLVFIFMVCIALVGVAAVLEILRTRILTRAALAFEANLLRALVLHPDPRVSGDTWQIVSDTRALREITAPRVLSALLDAPWIVLYLGLTLLIHPQLFFLALGLLVVVGACESISALGEGRRTEGANTLDRRLGDMARLLARGSRRYEPARRGVLISELTRLHTASLSHTIGSTRSHDLVKGISRFTRQFGGLAVFGLGAKLVIEGSISAGSIIAASILVMRALGPIDGVFAFARGWTRSRESRQRLKRQLSSAGEPPPVRILRCDEPGLRVRDLLIGSDGEHGHVAVSKIDLRPGQCLALVGPSGSGKSRLLAALAGAVPASRGVISLGPPPAGNDEPQIAYVPQEPEVWTGSIAEIVGSFTPCERDAVRQALKRAGCLEAIELLPRGLDTEPQKEGLVLPSGLRQQILIAQTMLSRPALAIFDCADAQLDVAGAQGFMAVLNDLKADGTIIMLASQRPAILNLADIIARMDQGQVIAVEDRRTRAPALAAVPSHSETGADAATSRAS